MGQIVFKNGTATRMTLTKQYDRQNRLTSVQAVTAGSAASGQPVGTGYQYDGNNRRVRANAADGSYWL